MSRLPGRVENEKLAGAEETKMTTRTAVSPWHWVTPPTTITQERHARRPAGQELWAGALYLMVWSVLWLAVIVTVLVPLDGVLGGAR